MPVKKITQTIDNKLSSQPALLKQGGSNLNPRNAARSRNGTRSGTDRGRDTEFESTIGIRDISS